MHNSWIWHEVQNLIPKMAAIYEALTKTHKRNNTDSSDFRFTDMTHALMAQYK